MAACPSCGAAATATGVCLNLECSSRKHTPPAFEAVDTLPPPVPAQTPAERIAELEAALRQYGQHLSGCPSRPSISADHAGKVRLVPCTCGLGKVLQYRDVS
jgi:hypothetical protein